MLHHALAQQPVGDAGTGLERFTLLLQFAARQQQAAQNAGDAPGQHARGMAFETIKHGVEPLHREIGV